VGLLRDVLDSAGSQIREAASPFTSGPDPLSAKPFSSLLFPEVPASSQRDIFQFLPEVFSGPSAFALARQAKGGTSASPAQAPQPQAPLGPIARARQRATQASSGASADLVVDTSSPFYGMALEAGKAAGLSDPTLYARLVAAESSFDPNAHNPSGAAGLSGLMPGTAAGLGVTNVYDPQQSLTGGARYLKQMLDRYNGDPEKALAAYNAGPGNVDQFGGIPPFEETQTYVRRILGKPASTPPAQPQYPQTTPAGEVPPPPPGVKPLAGLTTYQYGSESLATGAADYICGPIAAQAFVRSEGRSPTLQEALDMARHLGVIDPSNGMHGIDSTVQLIRSLGGSATAGAVEKDRIINEVEHGRPVIINTQGHYFVAEGYDRSTGKFDLGNSARALRASGGNTMYSLDEIGTLKMGAPRGAIYAGY
jgi:hypothetical protein